MKNSTRKVVILENITSPYIQQAIIVLNERTTVPESKVICDAEKIVDEYLKRNGYQGKETTKKYKHKQAKKIKGIRSIVGAILIFSAIMIYFVTNR